MVACSTAYNTSPNAKFMPAHPTSVFALRLTPTAERVLARAAKRRGLPLSTYIRTVALEQARRENAAVRQARIIRQSAIEVGDDAA